MIQVEPVQAARDVLSIRCSGVIDIGSASNASIWPVVEAVTLWLKEHPDDSVWEMVLDFTDVDYRWGDAPVSCFIPFLRRGVKTFRFLARQGTAQALEGLFRSSKVPGFTVDRLEA